MPGLDETFARLASNPLRWRIRIDQSWMLRFDPLELIHQLVEFGIRSLGIIEHVVAILVVPNFLAQRFDFLFDFGVKRGRHN